MNDLDRAGYALTDLVLTDVQCEYLAESLPTLENGRGGVRNLLSHPTVQRLLHDQKLGHRLGSLAGDNLVAVKATLFDKTPEANWRVQWHQDRAIAVKERLDLPGYGPWTTKSGTLHVDAPAAVLAQMLAIRVHLDACGPDNGPLRIIPGSHRSGKLSESQLAALVACGPMVGLYVPQGAILVMRPLLVHASSPAQTGTHRRVLHIELAPRSSIDPLQWHTAIPLRGAESQ